MQLEVQLFNVKRIRPVNAHFESPVQIGWHIELCQGDSAVASDTQLDSELPIDHMPTPEEFVAEVARTGFFAQLPKTEPIPVRWAWTNDLWFVLYRDENGWRVLQKVNKQ